MYARMSSIVGEEDPRAVTMQTAIPYVLDTMRSMDFESRTRDQEILAVVMRLDRREQELLAEVRRLAQQVQELQDRDNDYELVWKPSSSLRPARRIIPLSTSPPSSPSLPPRSMDGPAPCAPSAIESHSKEPEVPKYTLSRSVLTIPELWRQWTVGVNGSPSIATLDQQYGSRWRTKHSETQYYCVRKVIIDELIRRAEVKTGGYDANIADVVEELEAERKRAGASLSKMSGVLKKEKKAREAREQEGG